MLNDTFRPLDRLDLAALELAVDTGHSKPGKNVMHVCLIMPEDTSVCRKPDFHMKCGRDNLPEHTFHRMDQPFINVVPISCIHTERWYFS